MFSITAVLRAQFLLSGVPLLALSVGCSRSTENYSAKFAVAPTAAPAVPVARDADAPIAEVDHESTQFNTEADDRIYENPFLAVRQNPLSTFSIDVDTASYANVRRFLNAGSLPPKDAVRVEEMLNYFTYHYQPPIDDRPFAVHAEVAACPWQTKHRLLRIALKGREIDLGNRPPSNLVFLVDVSGSMNEPAKLPLLKNSLRLTVG